MREISQYRSIWYPFSSLLCFFNSKQTYTTRQFCFVFICVSIAEGYRAIFMEPSYIFCIFSILCCTACPILPVNYPMLRMFAFQIKWVYFYKLDDMHDDNFLSIPCLFLALSLKTLLVTTRTCEDFSFTVVDDLWLYKLALEHALCILDHAQCALKSHLLDFRQFVV